MAEAEYHSKRKCAVAFTRRGGRSPERAERVREAPAAQDACPRHLMEAENFLWGCFGGGMQGGRSVDVGNTTGNQEQVAALPRRQRLISVPFRPAAKLPMAAQIRNAGLASDCRAQPHNRPRLAARRAGVPNFAGRRNPAPAGRQEQRIPPRLTGEIARRAGQKN